MSAFNAAGVAFGHGTDNVWDEARWLVLGTLHLPFDSPDWVLDARLAARERQRLDALLARRGGAIADCVPAGEAWFGGLRFHVTPAVLVPRSPIAELLASGCEPWLDGRVPRRILDLCCGSGCIGIAAALTWPDAEVALADVSPEALEVARINVALHDVAARVRVVESDLFTALAGERFDLILCNPPYVDAADMAALPAEYRHEAAARVGSGYRWTRSGAPHSRRCGTASRLQRSAGA